MDWTLAQFGARRIQARRRYREFVAEGRNAGDRPWDEVSGQIYLGSDAFRERMATLVARARPGTEIPARQRRPVRPDLATIEREVLRAFGASFGRWRSGSPQWTVPLQLMTHDDSPSALPDRS